MTDVHWSATGEVKNIDNLVTMLWNPTWQHTGLKGSVANDLVPDSTGQMVQNILSISSTFSCPDGVHGALAKCDIDKRFCTVTWAQSC